MLPATHAENMLCSYMMVTTRRLYYRNHPDVLIESERKQEKRTNPCSLPSINQKSVVILLVNKGVSMKRSLFYSSLIERDRHRETEREMCKEVVVPRPRER